MAGEPEELDDDEPLARHVKRHAYDRTIMLADGVFAIAMTLLALGLKPPARWYGGIGELFGAMQNSLTAYLIGFAVVGIYWAGHRSLFARIRRVDVPLTVLALVLLCLIAATPAVAELLVRFGDGRAMKVYLLLIVAIGSMQGLIWGYSAFMGRLVDPSIGMDERLLTQVEMMIPPVIFLALLSTQGSNLFQPYAWPLVFVALALGLGTTTILRRRVKDRKKRAPAMEPATGEVSTEPA
ncbi:MAG TPA: TMEM175 family protein [Allosphingosinicella sp.]|nr:TMEM175 family protein [Allosphingosinicella sp.]